MLVCRHGIDRESADRKRKCHTETSIGWEKNAIIYLEQLLESFIYTSDLELHDFVS